MVSFRPFLLTVVVLLCLEGSPARADVVDFKTYEELLNFILDVKRGAVAQAVASDGDASPAVDVKGNAAGAGLFGTADTGLQAATRDDTHAEARARNSLKGKLVYVGDEKNHAGENGAYSSYAAITWKGKVVKDGLNEQFDPDRASELHQIVGDRLNILAESLAWFRLSLAYKIVDLDSADNTWWDDPLLLFDDLVADHGFSNLFDGTITVGDPTTDVFAGDFAGLAHLFGTSIDPDTHNGWVSYKTGATNLVDFVVPVPFFTSTQMLLIAADQQAFASGAQGGRTIVETVPEPSLLTLLGIGAAVVPWLRRRKVS